MKIRTAFIICGVLAMSAFLIPFSSQATSPKQSAPTMKAGYPIVWDLVLKDIPTTTTTTTTVPPPPPTTTTTTPPPPPTTTTTAPVRPMVVTGGSDATSTNTADWACIRQHESGDNYGEAGGGAYQFENGTWEAVTGRPGPAEAYPAYVQDAAALRLYSERGWEPWTTRYICGL